MQVLNKLEDRVKLKFDAKSDLNKSINNLLIKEANKLKVFPNEIQVGNFVDNKTENQKFEDDVVRNIMYDFKVEYPHDTNHLNFPNTDDEIRKQAADELEQKDKLDFALNESNWEIKEGIILDVKKDLIKTLAGTDCDISNGIVKLSNFNNGVVELEINDYDLKNCFEQSTNKLIQENNVDIVSKMLVDDIII